MIASSIAIVLECLFDRCKELTDAIYYLIEQDSRAASPRALHIITARARYAAGLSSRYARGYLLHPPQPLYGTALCST